MSNANDFGNQSQNQPQGPPWGQNEQRRQQQPPPFQGWQQAPPPYPPPYYIVMPPTNGKSIAAMVLGIASIPFYIVGFILGPIAIILARQAKNEIIMRGERGEGFATAGLVTGIIGLCISACFVVFYLIMILSIMHHY